MIFWYKLINLKKRWADVFQIYLSAIHFHPVQFWPSVSFLSFAVFSLSSSIVLSKYFDIWFNSMTIWSVSKLPKIAWPSPLKKYLLQQQYLPVTKVDLSRGLIVIHYYKVSQNVSTGVGWRKVWDSVIGPFGFNKFNEFLQVTKISLS